MCVFVGSGGGGGAGKGGYDLVAKPVPSLLRDWRDKLSRVGTLIQITHTSVSNSYICKLKSIFLLPKGYCFAHPV